VTHEEAKRRYEEIQGRIQVLETERVGYLRRRQPLPRRINADLAEYRVQVEKFRTWGNRALTQELKEARRAK
jgi:hypothetical protein